MVYSFVRIRVMRLINTAEAGEKLGVSRKRIFQLIQEGRLPAQKVGRDYVINEPDLRLVRNRRPGRPRTMKSVKDQK